jgi:hypothetical protein
VLQGVVGHPMEKPVTKAMNVMSTPMKATMTMKNDECANECNEINECDECADEGG